MSIPTDTFRSTEKIFVLMLGIDIFINWFRLIKNANIINAIEQSSKIVDFIFIQSPVHILSNYLSFR